ncbi:UNVERIFIED_CONTAM: hypothetical protein Sradi_5732100 [Sesamum radiatum]|uniref:Uncharacterized protein n=1 Tax=Sesamum radiatum TaxID=300843 RepID=A0AAW2L5P2_SESRA
MLADKVRKEFPDTEEGKNFLEAYWASLLASNKKSEDYKKDVALVAGPYLHFAFEACRQQFIVQDYPPAGEDMSSINFELAPDTSPDPFARLALTMETAGDATNEERAPDESLPQPGVEDILGPSRDAPAQEEEPASAADHT